MNISTGAKWEDIVGYSRGVRIKCILEIIEETLIKAGAKLSDVTRTRIFVTDISKWEEIGRAHGEILRTIKPATSMVEVSKLISPEFLVEIEATAIIRE